jgi:hypothetical protein
MYEKKANMRVCLVGKAVKMAKVKASITAIVCKRREIFVLEEFSSEYTLPTPAFLNCGRVSMIWIPLLECGKPAERLRTACLSP